MTLTGVVGAGCPGSAAQNRSSCTVGHVAREALSAAATVRAVSTETTSVLSVAGAVDSVETSHRAGASSFLFLFLFLFGSGGSEGTTWDDVQYEDPGSWSEGRPDEKRFESTPESFRAAAGFGVRSSCWAGAK